MLPASWNRSRAIALGVTLILHVVAAFWLLSLRFKQVTAHPAKSEIVWLPVPHEPPPLPRVMPKPPFRSAEPAAPTLIPESIWNPPAPPAAADWRGTARDVAGATGGGPSRRTFGEFPQAPAGRPKEATPPSIWKKPLPRVGTTVTTPEGETIIWVSDYCYVSVGTRSLTLDHIHKGREGVRTCVLYQFGGEKEARGDLFDSIKRPPPPQEPGCGPDGIGQSCGR